MVVTAVTVVTIVTVVTVVTLVTLDSSDQHCSSAKKKKKIQASSLWADAFYKSMCPCGCVLTFEVPLKLFCPYFPKSYV